MDVAYAYVLTHPGTPCVFWSHFFDFGPRTREKISQLMQVRRDAGLHAESALDVREANKGLYAAYVDGKVAMKIGSSFVSANEARQQRLRRVGAWRDGHLATPLAIMLFSSPQHQGGPFFLSGLAIFPFRVCGACQVRPAQPGR